MLDALRKRALGFDNTDKAQSEHRALERQLGDFQQGGRIGLGLAAHCDHHHFVHRLLARMPDARVGEPEQGMPPVKNLEQRLRVVHQDIAALDVGQFVQQYPPQLERGQLVRELLRDENNGPQKSVNGRTAHPCRELEADGPPDSHLAATGVEEVFGNMRRRDGLPGRVRDSA